MNPGIRFPAYQAPDAPEGITETPDSFSEGELVIFHLSFCLIEDPGRACRPCLRVGYTNQ